ncbi:Ribophorin II [Gigaspora margarita]|uniref:Ribophorin II n=2 Tax=Gigaspora margarita TaxID=4874 RepID=A0A8H3XEI7_GIGMA|nr:Ribophorin II [Gigaspora margarita]
MIRSLINIISWRAFLLVLLTSVLVQADDFVISDVKIAVTTSESVRKLYESIPYPSSFDKPIQLTSGDDFKMIFVVNDKQTQKGVQPHQAFLTLTSEKNGNQIPIIIRVRENGKSKVELDMKSAPDELLSSPGNYSLDLIIGTFSYNDPLKYHVGTLEIDVPIQSSGPSPVVYGPKPEIHHIFRPDEKLPPIWLSYSFMAIVLIPWVFLIGAWAYIGVNVSLLARAPESSLMSILFLGSLLAIEILFYNYWTHLNIFQTLTWLTGLSIVAFITGQKALSDVQKWRSLGLR